MPSVLCKYCGKEIDKGKGDIVSIPPGEYAHHDCLESLGPYEDRVLVYMAKILGDQMNETKIRQQYASMPISGKAIMATLKYFYEVKGGDANSANGGIGIVPYVKDEALSYWRQQTAKKKEFANLKNKEDYYLGNATYDHVYEHTIPYQRPTHTRDINLP